MHIRHFGSICSLLVACMAPTQEPATWDQLDAHPVPQWFQDANFGIFIHWGVYSVPAFCDTSTYSEWYEHWLDTNSHDGLVRAFHERVYGKDTPYRAFAEQFRCELWSPEDWAATFRRAGADYIVLTSKHHDGFALWPDAHGERVRGYPWNASTTGPRRDLVGELAKAVRGQGLRFGLYYSFLEWHNPLFERSIPDYVDQHMIPQVKDLIARYQPDVFWPDGEWEHDDSVWRSRELLQWIRASSGNRDEIVVNDRWGKGSRGEHGDYYTTEYGGYGGSKTYAGQKPFEECRGIGHSFAWNRAEGYDVYLSRTECVRTLIDLVSRGGKLLLDIGPAADGTIPLLMVDRLYAIGDWLQQNGESIRGCSKSPFRSTPWGRATQKGSTVYLHVYDWPKDGRLVVRGLQSVVERVHLVRDPLARLLAGRRQDPPGSLFPGPLPTEAAPSAPLVPLALGSQLLSGLPSYRAPDGALVIDVQSVLPSEHATVVAITVAGAPRVDDAWFADASGTLSLPASGSTVTGPSAKLDPKGQLAGFRSAMDAATWDAVQLEAGIEYDVQVEGLLAPGQEALSIPWELTWNGTAQTGTVPPSSTRASLARIHGDAQGSRAALTLRLAADIAEPGWGVSRLHLVPVSGLAAGMPLVQPLLRGMVNQLSEQLLQRSQLGDSPRFGSPAELASSMYAANAVLVPLSGAPIIGREAIGVYLIAHAERLVGVRQFTTEVRGGPGGTVVQFGRYARDETNKAKDDAWTGEFVRTYGSERGILGGITSETWWK